MRAVSLFAILLMGGAIGGCLGDDETDRDAADTGPEEPVLWTDLNVTLEGAAGEWLWAYQDLPWPTDSIHYRYDIEATFEAQEGEEWAGALLSPSLVMRRDSEGMIDTWLAYRPIVATGPYTLSEGWSVSSSAREPMFETVAFAVAATVPWKLTITFSLDAYVKENHIVPEHILRGNGTSYARGTDGALPINPIGVPFSATHETAEAGWSQFAILARKVTSTGIQDYKVSFANGNEENRQVTAIGGLYTPLAYTVAHFMGDFANDAGTNTLQTTYVRGHLDQTLLFLHAPGADAGLPPGVTHTGYGGTPLFGGEAAGVQTERVRLR